jgi:hypothetical protein
MASWASSVSAATSHWLLLEPLHQHIHVGIHRRHNLLIVFDSVATIPACAVLLAQLQRLRRRRQRVRHPPVSQRRPRHRHKLRLPVAPVLAHARTLFNVSIKCYRLYQPGHLRRLHLADQRLGHHHLGPSTATCTSAVGADGGRVLIEPGLKTSLKALNETVPGLATPSKTGARGRETRRRGAIAVGVVMAYVSLSV